MRANKQVLKINSIAERNKYSQIMLPFKRICMFSLMRVCMLLFLFSKTLGCFFFLKRVFLLVCSFFDESVCYIIAPQYYLKVTKASYSDTSNGENFTTKLPFFPAGILPLSGSITKGNTSLPPSLTTLPAS